MERDGVIRRTSRSSIPVAVGLPITVLVEVTLTNDRSATVSAVKRFFRDAPEVQQCYCVTGTAGFILVLLVPSMEDYETRTAWLFADNEMVRSYRTIVVLDRVKVTSSLPPDARASGSLEARTAAGLRRRGEIRTRRLLSPPIALLNLDPEMPYIAASSVPPAKGVERRTL